jgi:hypothetical protein
LTEIESCVILIYKERNMNFVFHAPQIIWICLAGLSLLVSAITHNTEVENKMGPVSSFITAGLGVLLWWWGGVFKVFELPQIILVASMILGCFSVITSFKKTFRSDFFDTAKISVIMFGLLYWAGFFTGAV